MNYYLKYNAPAENSHKGWENYSLPIGNSYMGMCIFGRIDTERLQFNEKSLWQGGPSPKRPQYNGGNIEGKYPDLVKLQNALKNKDIKLAKKLRNNLVGQKEGYGNYLDFGSVMLEFNHNDIKEYERGLDILTGIAYTTYIAGGISYSREYFASYPNKVIVGRLEAQGNNLNVNISIDISQKGAEIIAEDNFIVVQGKLEDNDLKYYAKLGVETDGKLRPVGNKLEIKNAKEVVFYLSSATDYANNYPTYRGEKPQPKVDSIIKKALKDGYNALLNRHKKDMTKLMENCNIYLGSEPSLRCTDELINRYSLVGVNDKKYLTELLFMYGRYLLVASSRAGTLPANLQGVWNDSNSPIWGSDYHLNVNMQMCYNHAYTTGLSECAMPMIDYMESLRKPGRITAKEYNNIVSDENNENGWICHNQNTPFGWTCPGWDFDWGWSPASSSWMMQNMYEYYLYTNDMDMLKNIIYPTMKENAKFWVQNLIYDEQQDRYVSSPCFSPEHGPISQGNTFEQELIWQLFDYTIEASEILEDNCELIDKIKQMIEKLKPLAIGKWGQIKEWYEEDEWYSRLPFVKRLRYKANGCQARHRHASHLLGVYPGNHINNDDKELMQAAVVSLTDRGIGTQCSGWGKANKINLWARLKKGEYAFDILEDLIKKNITTNLWDMHPPFQMDGNCGLTSGIKEMLMYSNKDYIELLPAIPQKWARGSFKGLCAIGGVTVNCVWEDGIVTNYTLYSSRKKLVKVFVNGKYEIVETMIKK